jgi:hypothetical protein
VTNSEESVKTARHVYLTVFMAALVVAIINPLPFERLREQVTPTSSKF